MPSKQKDILKLKKLDVPWITEDGHIDLTKLPIDSVLKQAISDDNQDLGSACRTLLSMYYAGRTEAVVFLYGLFTFYQADIGRKQTIVESLGRIETKEFADILFRELEQTESSNTTRGYINSILRRLKFFPLEIVEQGFERLLNDGKWSYRMKRKFGEIIDEIKYRQ